MRLRLLVPSLLLALMSPAFAADTIRLVMAAVTPASE